MTALLAATPAHLTVKIAYLSILPMLALLGGALVILVWSSLLRRPLETVWITSLTVLAATAALVLSLMQYFDVIHHGAHVAIDGAIVSDGFSAFVAVLVSAAVVVAALVGDGWLQQETIRGPEFHVLVLVSASGAMVMGAANDLIVVFLGLEILSIALYVLAAFNARRRQSGEAALKYFVLGGFSSAVFLYGIALVYGSTGTTNLPQIASYLAQNYVLHNGMLLAGLALLLVGFGFKAAAVPFHLWTPDVYQGSPSPVTGFMAAVAKVGAFAALLRVFVSSFGLLRADWQPAVWVIAVASLLLGASVALVQRDIKRMLAYSSINHAGFILLGLQAGSTKGVEGSLYYLFAYSFLALGSFAVISVVGGPGDGRHGLDRYRGLARRQPWLAGALALFLVAQAGIPPTTGFWAKLEVLQAAAGAHSYALAVIAMLSAVIAGFFYLRVVVLMYSPAGATGDGAATGTIVDTVEPARAVGDEGEPVGVAPGGEAGSGAVALLEADTGESAEPLVIPGTTGIALALCAGATVVLGIYPAWLTDFAHQATLLFHP